MPDAELRRQRAAYLRGVLRTAAVSAATLALVAGLGIKERLEDWRKSPVTTILIGATKEPEELKQVVDLIQG